MPIDWRSPRASYIVLDVEGQQFDFFHDYSVVLDLLSPGGEFHFSASQIPSKRGVRTSLGERGLVKGRKVQLRLVTPLGTSLQHTGRLYEIVTETARKGGSTCQVTVRSAMFPLVHADAVRNFSVENITFADLIHTVAAPFGFAPSDITIDQDASRNLMTGKPTPGTKLSPRAPLDIETMKIDQAGPNAGENAYAFLTRHARRFGLLIWETPEGKIVVGRPDYEQPARYEIRCLQGIRGKDNNAKSIRRRESFSQRPSEVHVYGKSHGGDYTRSSVHEVAYDNEVREAGIFAPVTVHDQNAKDATQARERAEWELGRRRQTADVVQVLLARHCASDGTAYAIDTIANVRYDVAGLDGPMYVTKREFHASKQGGSETTLTLVPRYSISIGEGIFSAAKSSGKFDQSRGTPTDVVADDSPYAWMKDGDWLIAAKGPNTNFVEAGDPNSTIPGVVTTVRK